MGQITPEQLQAVLQYAAGRMGMTPQELSRLISQENVGNLTEKLPPDRAEKFTALLRDHAQVEKWMASPEIRRMIQKLGEEKG